MLPSLRVPFLVGVAAALLMSIGSAWAADEGPGYVALRPPVATATGNQVEVVEVFWYGCPHCWHLEPMMNTWVGTLPAGVAFRRVPGTLGRWEPHARAYYAAESLGKLDVFHPALFKAMQVDRRPIFQEDDLVKFAGEIGIDPEAFRAAYESFTVEAKVRKAADLNTRYGIDGVPAVIVNGKYRTSPSQANGQERMFEILSTLVGQELPAKGAAAPAAVAPK
jgi:protein dithiol oxidoreductase (disulfide-forming)